MKKRVEFSSYCRIVTSIIIIFVCCILFATVETDNIIATGIWGAAVAVLLLSALCFMPLSFSLDKESLRIRRPLKTKSIPLSDIAAVRLCPPTMGAIRIIDSGEWFGWYGWFKEKDLGKYIAYYGKASDCFPVTFKDGKKYILGCKDAPAMVKAIAEATSVPA